MTDNDVLTPEQMGAREFWRQAAAGDLASSYFFNEFLDIHSRYEEDEFEAMQADIDQLLGDLGYGTDMDTVSNEFSAGATVDYGYWFGSYVLFDDEGSRYWLIVGRSGATLQLPPSSVDLTQDEIDSVDKYKSFTILTNSEFANGQLTLSNDRFAFKLGFERAITDDQISQNGVDVNTLLRRSQPRCNGSVVITQNGVSRSLSAHGKRGSYTREGVMQADDGDPIATWVGSYSLIDTTDNSAWRRLADPLVIDADDQGISLRWGALKGTNTRFNNNVLASELQGEVNGGIALKFEILSDGSKRFQAAMTRNGEDQNLLGFWTDHAEAPHRVTPAPKSPAFARRLSAMASASDTLPLDMQKVSGAVVSLPKGVVPNNEYRLLLTLENASVIGAPPYNWAIVPPVQAASLIANSTTATLVVMPSTANAGFLDININLKQANAPVDDEGKTVTLRLEVPNLAPLVVTPSTLPPVVRGMDYKVSLGANGGKEPYAWVKGAGTSLPEGFEFDPDEQTLKSGEGGADISDSQDVYALQVKVSSDPSVVMAPLTVNFPINIVEPSQVGKASTDYVTLAIGVIGSIFLGITTTRVIYEWRKAAQKNAGDPTYKENYVMAKELATSLKAGIEGAIGRSFVQYIETALQYDARYFDPSVGDSKLEKYDKMLHDYNYEITTLMRDRNKHPEKYADNTEYQRQLDELKIKFMRELNTLDADITTEMKEKREEERSQAAESSLKKLRERIKWRR